MQFSVKLARGLAVRYGLLVGNTKSQRRQHGAPACRVLGPTSRCTSLSLAIPIYRRSGGAGSEQGLLVAHALVDAEDWHRFRHFRWRLANGYAVSTASKRNPVGPELNRTYFLHRLILGLGLDDGRYTDHINRDKLDNRRANLRIVTRPQNNQNQAPRKGGTSRYRGVNFHPHSGLWAVRVKANGQTLSGGYFKDEDEAGAAAARLRAEHMPYAV
jgi:hypothetical protein